MIDHLRHMAVFARVVDEGSFRAAARDLGLAPSRISETVSELEAFLGTTLLYRTTRKIALTNEGRAFYARVVDMLRSAETGLNELNAQTHDPAGALRISIPAFLAGGPLTRAIATYSAAHPNVALSLVYTDHRMQLIEDGLDMSIRAGWLEDSSMMARKLGTEGRLLVASTEYVAPRSPWRHPKDLETWDWIRFTHRPAATTLVGPKGDKMQVMGASRIEADSIEAVYQLVLEHAGVAVVPEHMARAAIAAGELVHLLPDWTLAPLGLYAVWPDKSRRESLTVHFVRHLAAHGI